MGYVGYHILSAALRLRKRRRHVVKSVSNFGDLGSTLCRYPLSQVSAGNGAGSSGQSLKRRRQAPAQEGCRDQPQDYSQGSPGDQDTLHAIQELLF
jgi:hypothetical protein